MRVRYALWAILGVPYVASVCAAAPLSPEYRTGLTAFRDPRYLDAVPPLSAVWYRLNGRRSDVSYMVGVSLCRTGLPQRGRNWLNHTLLNYNLSSVDRDIVVDQIQKCETDKSIDAPSPIVEDWSISGELLYYGDAKVPAVPLRSISTNKQIDLAERLVRLGQPEEAARRAAALASMIGPLNDRTKKCNWSNKAVAKVNGRYRFISLYGMQDAYLSTISRYLDIYLGELSNKINIDPSENYITIVLAACSDNLGTIARDMHQIDIDAAQTRGYSVDEDSSLVAVWDGNQEDFSTTDSQTRRTVRHELFHLLAHRSFGDMPQWLDEGLAQYLGVIDERSNNIAFVSIEPQAWGALPSLRDVVESPWLTVDTVSSTTAGKTVSMATPNLFASQVMMRADVARMFLAYVDSQNKLGALFKAFKSRDPEQEDQPSAQPVAIIEKVMGAKWHDIEVAYAASAIVCTYIIDESDQTRWVDGPIAKCKLAQLVQAEPSRR